MGWFRVALTADELEIVHVERDAHPGVHVRRKMLVLWLLHCDLSRAKAAEVGGVGRAIVQRSVAADRAGGLDGLRPWDVVGPVSDLATHTEAIRDSLSNTPVRTVAEACDRIEALTEVRRQPTLESSTWMVTAEPASNNSLLADRAPGELIFSGQSSVE